MLQKLQPQELGRVSVTAFKLQHKAPITVVLDNLRSMHNVGSVFRTCDCFAVERLMLCGITGQPPHREIEKTALGATASVLWEYSASTSLAINALQQANYQIIAMEQVHGSVSLHQFQPKEGEKYALIFGNEVNGVSNNVMTLVDQCIEIPQFGTKHSLNVSVCVGIALWDICSKLRFKDHPVSF